MFRVKLFEFCHHLGQVIIRRRRQMESAHQSVDLVNSGYFLHAQQRVDDTSVATRANHYEPAITKSEASGVLIANADRARVYRPVPPR